MDNITETVIKPKSSLLEIDFKELWRNRDLFSMFVKRNIVTQYKQTILGPAWFFIQPALTTIMYMVVFGGIAGIPTDGLPQPMFYLAGIVCWQYFADCLTKTSSTFIDNQNIFGKVYFPRLIVPLSTVASNLVRMFIQFLLFVAVYVFYLIKGVHVEPNIYILLVPVLIIMLAGLSLGFGIIISSLTTKYRDLTILFNFIVQLWMYATPIIYPLSTMPPDRQWIMALNPLTSIIEAFKYGTMGVGTFSWGQLAYSFGFMVVLLAVGIVIFNKVQRTFMDTI
ncbi:MAG TPA: ABC transporter permease [Paludibacteraceae bacterium]|nr:ABC transporter permease [Paludibacteraceae bacterium]OPZ01728.1 MAG: Teichoic acid translocation permease protein TagG [Bacteroidetes bacterium ADurb.BinA395]HOF98962.1 ABC transporter permease [Paludibacteraceae bacterium]HOJ66378.1 ABC transporter permease [Paludibacteraceae bacterium]HOL29861.1 ABC transporter permease [Paludibacteraceae bacterium]